MDNKKLAKYIVDYFIYEIEKPEDERDTPWAQCRRGNFFKEIIFNALEAYEGGAR
jgi:hypothetical protein